MFKKVEVQPEDGVVEAFTRPLQWGMLSLQAFGGYNMQTGKFHARWGVVPATSKLWENTPIMKLRRAELGINDRLRGALRWDIDVRPPNAQGGIGEGSAVGFADMDFGSYHVMVPRVELKIDLSRENLIPQSPEADEKGGD